MPSNTNVLLLNSKNKVVSRHSFYFHPC